MASRVKSLSKSTVLFPADLTTVREIETALIKADFKWNSRSAVKVDDTDDAGNGSRGWFGNLYSIAKTGQRDACTVRLNHKYGQAGELPYELVTGFGRFKIVTALAAGEFVSDLTNPNKGGLTQVEAAALKNNNPTIRAIVKDLSDFEARAENLGENVQRDSLSGPDLAVGVMHLRDSNPTLTDNQVALLLNKNQAFVSKVKRIADGLRNVMLPAGALAKDSPAMPILDAWRTDVCKVTQDDMDSISREKDDTKKVKLYAEKRAKKAATPTGAASNKGKGKLIPNIISVDLPVIALMLVKLIRLGVIVQEGTFDSKEAMLALLSVKRASLAELTPDQVDALSGALETAMTKATAEVKAAAKAAGSKAAAAPAAETATPAKGKGKPAAINGARI